MMILGWWVGLMCGLGAMRWACRESRRGHILCTPSQVVEAVIQEYRWRWTRREYVGGSATIYIDSPELSAERIAENLGYPDAVVFLPSV